MPKPALKISFVFEQGSRRPEVTTICTGDINGDGIKEIIYGGGIGEFGGSQVSVRKSISQNEVPITQINVGGGFIKQTICFDVNNDGKDEIICGNTKNEIFILLSSNGRLVQSNSISLKNEGPINQISDIKAIKFDETPYIIACSTCGNLSVICVKNNELYLVSTKEIPFVCFSLLPVIWKDKLILLIGGISRLYIFEVKDGFSLNKLDEMFFPDLVIEEKDKEDSIYDIILFDTQEDYFRFFCGCRSKNLIFFKFSKELEFISDFSCEGSIYSISRGDIDRFGKNELIITGIIRRNPEIRGFIQICKIEDDDITPICIYEYKQRIFSAQPFFDKETDRDYILISAENEEFVCLKIIYFDEICEVISKLGINLKNFPGEYCFFVGAGFSFPIFPSADDLSKKLIEKSGIPRENIIEYLLKNEKTKAFLQDGVEFPERIPLEAILFWYKNQFSRREVIGFLLDHLGHNDKEIPNHFIIIKRLMKNSFINYVFTVNYDLLLESVINDIEPLITENDFISTKICQKNAILKLHGSIEKPESIEASLDEVGQIGENKKVVLEFLFTGHTIFFVGYSCRDPDLYPALKDIVQRYGTSCYFVDPNELSEQAKEVLTLSGKGDINSRHLQVPAGLFFDYLISKMDIGKDDDVNLNGKEVK
jgi:hypothetical protein